MLARTFRRIGPAPELLLLIAGAWLTATLVTTVAGALVGARPSAPLANAPAEVATRAPLPLADPARLARLLGLEPERDPGEAPGPRALPSCDDPEAMPVRSGADLVLVAGVLASPAERSLASIAGAPPGETTLLTVGEERAGIRLLEVLPIRRAEGFGNAFELVAVVCRNGTKEYVDAPGTAPMIAGHRDANANAPADRMLAHLVAPGRFEIDRAALEALLSDPGALLTDARVVPAVESGAVRGFRVVWIRPGSGLWTLGLQPGDVVRRIDGYEIGSIDRALELYARLPNASRVRLELERGGADIEREYVIAGL